LAAVLISVIEAAATGEIVATVEIAAIVAEAATAESDPVAVTSSAAAEIARHLKSQICKFEISNSPTA
jgi:hypothetical protein